jgi:hypothetical protein
MGGAVAAIVFVPAASIARIVRGDQSESFQKIQGSIYRREVGSGIGKPHGSQNLIGGNRMMEFVHGIENQSALAGHPESAVAHCSLQQLMTGHISPYCNLSQ